MTTSDAIGLRVVGLRNNRGEDGDYPGTVALLLAADAPTRQSPPVGDEAVDALLAAHRPG